MKQKMLVLMMIVCLMFVWVVSGEEVTEAPASGDPTVQETDQETENAAEEEETVPDIGMLSMGDSLHRYPDKIVTNDDESVTEFFFNVTDEEYNAFSGFLSDNKAKLELEQKETTEEGTDGNTAGEASSVDQAADSGDAASEKDTTGESTAEEPDAAATETEASPENADSAQAEGEEQQAAEEESPIKKGIITVENTEPSLAFYYNAETLEAEITYPKGTYDARIREAETRLESAQKLFASGEQYQAAVEFQTIPDYGLYIPAGEYRASDSGFDAVITKIEYYQTPGNIVTLGSYEQDNDESNGPEAIEWVVLDAVNAEKTLLISRRAIEAMQYNPEFSDTSWLDSPIRSWLNDEFLKTAFSEKEVQAILLSDVDNSAAQGNESYGSYKIKNGQDQMFLLSYAEACQYFSTNEERMCAPTEYVLAKGIIITNQGDVDGQAACWWWLRSPGFSLRHGSFIGSGGMTYSYGVNYTGITVRPAFWISLETVIENGL